MQDQINFWNGLWCFPTFISLIIQKGKLTRSTFRGFSTGWT